jgi:hypothetical protein
MLNSKQKDLSLAGAALVLLFSISKTLLPWLLRQIKLKTGHGKKGQRYSRDRTKAAPAEMKAGGLSFRDMAACLNAEGL